MKNSFWYKWAIINIILAVILTLGLQSGAGIPNACLALIFLGLGWTYED